MVPELEIPEFVTFMVPRLVMVAELETVLDILTVNPTGITFKSAAPGTVPPQVAGSVHDPSKTTVNVAA
jgi:hypothetical protein